MQEQSTLYDLEKQAREMKDKFLSTVEPYRTQLWKYCFMLTKSPWDAEDLVQETLMRTIASLGQLWQPVMPKSYLFRIATNTWSNQLRQKRRVVSVSEEDQLENYPHTDEATEFQVIEAVETLVDLLPQRQVVVIILNDVFDFTAKETAEILSTTEGAVKALLHRARNNLKMASKKAYPATVDERSASRYPAPNPDTVKKFIQAFHERDAHMMAELFADNAHNDIVHIGQEFGKEEITNNSIKDTFKFWIGALQAEYHVLWGRPVIVVLMENHDKLKLKSLIYLETDHDKISFKQEYYFCKDLLEEVGKVLGVSVDER